MFRRPPVEDREVLGKPPGTLHRVFRDRARARRRSQELDRPLRLVSVPALASLLAIVVVMLAGGLWLFGGHVTVKVQAPGVLVNPPGNAPVISTVNGVVAAPLTPVGTHVGPGEVVAQVRRTDGSINQLTAPVTGTVVSLSSGVNAAVKTGQTVLTRRAGHGTDDGRGVACRPRPSAMSCPASRPRSPPTRWTSVALVSSSVSSPRSAPCP